MTNAASKGFLNLMDFWKIYNVVHVKIETHNLFI